MYPGEYLDVIRQVNEAFSAQTATILMGTAAAISRQWWPTASFNFLSLSQHIYASCIYLQMLLANN
jgi:hypothetical protein